MEDGPGRPTRRLGWPAKVPGRRLTSSGPWPAPRVARMPMASSSNRWRRPGKRSGAHPRLTCRDRRHHRQMNGDALWLARCASRALQALPRHPPRWRRQRPRQIPLPGTAWQRPSRPGWGATRPTEPGRRRADSSRGRIISSQFSACSACKVPCAGHDDSTRDAVCASNCTALGGGCRRRQGVGARQTVQDGALRPIVPVTAMHEVFQRRLHRQQLR